MTSLHACRPCAGTGQIEKQSMEDLWVEACMACRGTGRDERARAVARQVQRQMIAALYWKAGALSLSASEHRAKALDLGEAGWILHRDKSFQLARRSGEVEGMTVMLERALEGAK